MTGEFTLMIKNNQKYRLEMVCLQVSPMRKLTIVSVISLFSTSLISISSSIQASPSKEKHISSESPMHDISSEWIDPAESGLREIEITDQDLPVDLSDSIRKYMRQPLKEEGKLSEEFRKRGLGVDTQGVLLSQWVPTTATPEKIQKFFNDSPLSTYIVGHTIVDKESGEKVGALVSTVDRKLIPTVFFMRDSEYKVDTCTNRAKRGVSLQDAGGCALEMILDEDSYSIPVGTYIVEKAAKKAAKAAFRMAIRVLPGGFVWTSIDGIKCIIRKWK
ncbi:hypothetical protein [Pasteuria penetrans]|uniref:hypothetical protein n=1 Tax=Pasteuria penetrans TaxID=86005 RepID=UPI0011F02815|nr:hypothetical protein [Pasteuria penetrans]